MDTMERIEQQAPTTAAGHSCRELRLALVCYGGVSLAIYMHGITVELQRLVVASARLCNYPDEVINPFPPGDTEAIYWDALKAIATNGNHTTLSVVVDVIAGTSAGGINAIVLAKALARGVQQTPLREVWFEKASLFKLCSPFGRKGVGKWPIWAPLNGRLMSKWAFTALHQMNDLKVTGPAAGLPLVPRENELDLYVTTTDCAGLQRTIEAYDPESFSDLEYRHILHFRCVPTKDDAKAENERAFGSDQDRMLTLAVRSTSSFPGAFPPVTLDEVESVAGPFGHDELKPYFGDYDVAEADPRNSYFLDGGVLNNRPFNHAVRAIRKHSANREVDRRLLFIDPSPVEPAQAPDRTTKPNWFGTVRAALTRIPRHQPVADALAELTLQNARAVELRQLIAITEPRVMELIKNADRRLNPNGSKADNLAALSIKDLENLTTEVRTVAQESTASNYPAYEAIKMGEVLSDLSMGLCKVLEYPEASRFAALVHRMVRIWATRQGFLLHEAISEPAARAQALNEYDAAGKGRKGFLKTFDLQYRHRRLRFLIRCVNLHYVEANSKASLRAHLDGAKQRLYKLIEELQRIEDGAWLKGSRLDDEIKGLFGPVALGPLIADAVAADLVSVPAEAVSATGVGASEEAKVNLDGRLGSYIDSNSSKLRSVFDQLGVAVADEIETFWSKQGVVLDWLLNTADLPAGFRQQMLQRYVGFPHWDTILHPLVAMSGVVEPDPVEVIRISPCDTTMLKPTGVAARLKGVTARNFGAFMKRSYRENDFLWGRLDGVERFIALLADVQQPKKMERAERDKLIWKGFKAVLDTEMPDMHRRASREVATLLRAQVDKKL